MSLGWVPALLLVSSACSFLFDSDTLGGRGEGGSAEGGGATTASSASSGTGGDAGGAGGMSACGDGEVNGAEQCDGGAGCDADCRFVCYVEKSFLGETAFEAFSGNCYYFDQGMASHASAVRNCALLGPGFHLATAPTVGTLEFVASRYLGVEAWVGANDTEFEGTWVWPPENRAEPLPVDGSLWASGEPNGGTLQNCASFWPPSFGSLIDTPCDDVRRYLCSRYEDPGPGRCGNGEREQSEECDDGNVMSDDGCDGACKLECELPSDPQFYRAYADVMGQSCWQFGGETDQVAVARAACDSLGDGFTLARLHTNVDRLIATKYAEADVWVDAFEPVEATGWIWESTDQPIVAGVNFEPWAPGEPSGAADEDCAIASRANVGGMVDVPCDTMGGLTFDFACRLEIP